MADIQSTSPLGKDVLKGSIFFGSNLTPSGTFSNVPQTTATLPPSEAIEAKLILTLQQVKEELQKNAKDAAGSTTDVLSETAVNTFLVSYIQLLIDYSDMRNYIFFGSSYTELTYHINFLSQNYPFKSFIARNVTGPLITLTPISGGNTKITFDLADVLQPANYTYDNSGKTIWVDYDVVDENGTIFPITNSSFVFNVIAATNTPTINVTISSITSGLQNGNTITITDVLGNTNTNGTHLINNVVIGVNTTTFDLVGVSGSGNYISGGIINLNKAEFDVTGNISSNNFIEYNPSVSLTYKGLIISPRITVVNDFETQLDSVQEQLLSLTNPTPWPRALITNNIVIEGPEFDIWITDPTNMSSNYNADEFGYITNTDIDSIGLSLNSALTLDESSTNQLIRRAIPHRLIDELRDTKDKFFTRFVLLAGKMFDTIKVYIDFLKYTKELNYTPFNQLSPDFYRLYAEHYGFDLFDDENIDLAKAVIKTEPGLSYDNQNNAVYNDAATSKTVKELQNEKQKRLLINLFYLYSTKGTLKCIDVLAKLLGSPEGLVVFEEQAFNQTTGCKFTENEKFKVPQIAYEIDPDYLKDSTNIASPINLPYVYRLKLDNDNIINLRELNGHTDPQAAIQQEVIKYGTKTYEYGHFENGSFATLQNNSSTSTLNGYYLLPLSFPDKYCGVTVEYMLPRDGFAKGIGKNLDEASIHLASLYLVDSITYTPTSPNPLSLTNQYLYKTPQAFMKNIVGQNDTTSVPFKASFTVNSLTTIDVQVNGVLIGNCTLQSTIKRTALAITNAINFQDNTLDYIAYCKEDAGSLASSFTITVESKKESTLSIPPTPVLGVSVDGGMTYVTQSMSTKVIDVSSFPYIITKLEGTALVVRTMLLNENSLLAPPLHRIAMLEDVFNADGLNHELRLIYRPEGIEVYQDFKYLALARWRDPSTASPTPFFSYDCPKSEISSLVISPLPNLFAFPDDELAITPNPGYDLRRWWDLFIGLPVNVDMFFKRVAVQELPSINHPDSLDFGIDASGQDVEKYSFNFINQVKDIDNNYLLNQISIPCEYKSPNPLPLASGSTNPDLIDSKFLSYPNSLIIDLKLVNQTYLGSGAVRFSQDVQNFFKLPDGEIITIDSLFKFNGWSQTLHKDYTYKSFNEVYNNYQTFSEQVLTYLSLLPFMELIEDKFKQLISQFIPIVVNIATFGRLIRALEANKVRYYNIHKTCTANIDGCAAKGSFRVVHGTNNGFGDLNNNLNAKIQITKFITNASNTTPITITTTTEHNFTNGSVIDIVNVFGNTAANGSWTVTTLTPFTFSLNTSIGNGAYTSGGQAIGTPIDLGTVDWNTTNTQTATDFSNNISVFPVLASSALNVVIIEVDAASFQIAYQHNINDCNLVVVANNNVQVDSIKGFGGGYGSITIPNSCFLIKATNNIPVALGFDYEYIYFDSEQALETYIYQDGEVIAPGPNYIYIF